MFASAFHVGRLVTWVGVFAVLGGIPKLLFLFLPEDWNRHTLAVASGGKPVYAGEAIHWAPDILLVAAAVTVVVGTVFVYLHSLTVNTFQAWGGEVDGRTLPVADAPVPARLMVKGFRAVRTVVALVGVGLILAGVPLFWMAIVNGDILDRMGLVKMITGGGAGLATGAAFYSHR